MFYMSKYPIQGVEVSFINMSCLREGEVLYFIIIKDTLNINLHWLVQNKHIL